MPLTPYQKNSISWLGIALVAVIFVWKLAPVLMPFVVAAVCAYALTPLVDALNGVGKGRVPRVLAVIVVELSFFVALCGVLLLVVPILTKDLPQMRDQIPALLDSLNLWLKPHMESLGLSFSLEITSIKTFVLKYLNANIEDALTSLLSSLKMGGSVAMAVITNAVLIPVALFYLLMEWHRFAAQAKDTVPPRLRNAVTGFMTECDDMLGQYLRGQLLVMLGLALFYSSGLLLFGLDLALPIGVFTGLAVFVPYLGFGVGLVLAALAGILQFSLTKAALMVAVVYGSGQMLESFVLTPRLVGERIGLHPLMVIFALMAFGQMLGFISVLIALPVSAVLQVACRRMRVNYMRSSLYGE